MAKTPIEIYQGKMTYNVVSLYSNGTKKRFSGFIVLIDGNGNEASYKINSFRSQVTIQSEALGERGMAGKSVTAHGYFKENTWNGQTTMELMCEKLYIEGHEQLAVDAEASSMSLPAVPPGVLPGAPVAPIAPAGPVPSMMPTPPSALPAAPTTPGIVAAGPAPIAGAYIHVDATPAAQPITHVQGGPAPMAGAYIHTEAAAQVPVVAPVVAPVATQPKPRKPKANVPVPPTPIVAILDDDD